MCGKVWGVMSGDLCGILRTLMVDMLLHRRVISNYKRLQRFCRRSSSSSSSGRFSGSIF